MSGPVWKKHEGDGTVCDKCLSETDESFRQGEIVDGEFQIWQNLCGSCYGENIDLITQRD